jgi:hypothetical protein
MAGGGAVKMFADLKESVIDSIERAIIDCQRPEWRREAAKLHTSSERMAAELIYHSLFEKQIQPSKPIKEAS